MSYSHFGNGICNLANFHYLIGFCSLLITVLTISSKAPIEATFVNELG